MCGPGANSIATPIASTGIKMSLKRIAASTPSARMGCSVTSTARSGVLHISRKEERSLIARYSGM
jgi:hypothetical protein